MARLTAQTKTGKVCSEVRLLNTDDQGPHPKVVCSTANSRIDLQVDGTDLFCPFTVEAKTQCAPLESKIMLASKTQRLLGNFINFGGATKVRLSGNFQGRIESRTHYGKIFLEEPRFVKIEGAVMTIPSLSDRNASGSQLPSPTTFHVQNLRSMASTVSHHSNLLSPRTPSQETSMSWSGEDVQLYQQQQQQRPPHSRVNSYHQQQQQPSPPGSINELDTRAESVTGSYVECRSPTISSRSEKSKKKDEDKESTVTRELIGTIGEGPGLIMIKNSSGDITVELI